jgi:hypothetical protein
VEKGAILHRKGFKLIKALVEEGIGIERVMDNYGNSRRVWLLIYL